MGDKIRALRQSFQLSQVELAKALNISKQCVSNWENNYIQPSVEMLVKLARFFNVSADYILDIEPKQSLDVSGLTEKQSAHIKLLIEDLKRANET